MLHEIAVEAGKSIWHEVAEEVLKKGATAVVVEGTKAILDVLKRRRIRRDEWEFQQWKKAQEPDEETEDKESSEGSNSDEKDSDEKDSDEKDSDEKDSDEKDSDGDDPSDNPEGQVKGSRASTR